MKKAILMFLLAALLTAPLTGCDTADSGDEPTKTTTESKDNDNTLPEYNAADANPASDFEYEVGEDGGITITKYIGTDTTVVIPEKIDGKDVTVIRLYAFRRTNIVTVQLPDTVTLLETGAFEECEALVPLDIIRRADIQKCAFKSCTSLKHIKIPKSVTAFGYEIFALAGLETIELEDGLRSLGDSMFIGCNLKEISVPNSITILPTSVFSGNNLESITLHEGLKEIGSGALGYNDKLTEIVIPASVETVYESFVGVCASIQSIKYQGNAPTFISEEFRDKENLNYTVYYHEGATGFTSPEWNGYKTEIW